MTMGSHYWRNMEAIEAARREGEAAMLRRLAEMRGETPVPDE